MCTIYSVMRLFLFEMMSYIGLDELEKYKVWAHKHFNPAAINHAPQRIIKIIDYKINNLPQRCHYNVISLCREGNTLPFGGFTSSGFYVILLY